MFGRRDVLAAIISSPLIASRAAAVRLTPADQRIDPNPARPGSFEVRTALAYPPYAPERPVSGPIRLWGHGNRKLPWMRNLIDSWNAGFRRFHPDAGVQYHMWGTSSGVPSLFNGTGDLAILGEEILPDEARAFERFKGYPPTTIQLMTGSVDIRNFDYAQQVFVHRDNPLDRISLIQLDGILGDEHRRGKRNLRRWGDLGLGGTWAQRPIQPYSWAIDDSFGAYLEGAVLLGSHHWNPALREFVHITYPDGSIYDHGQQILDALSQDPGGIAVSNIRYARREVKALPLSTTAFGPFVQASKSSLIDQSYPLARTLPAVIDMRPDGEVHAGARAFLRYVLSREGQLTITSDGRYLPLSPKAGEIERRRLA